MLRVVLVVSNFLQTPDSGGAGRNQQPPGRCSLRERRGHRAINRPPSQRIRAPWHCGHANSQQNRLHPFNGKIFRCVQIWRLRPQISWLDQRPQPAAGPQRPSQQCCTDAWVPDMASRR